MDYDGLVEEIAGWMQGKLREAHATGFVIGLSGGVDSATAAALCKRAAGDEVLGVWMPCNSVAEDEVFSKMVADALGIKLTTVDLCAAYDAMLEALPAGNKMARAIAWSAVIWRGWRKIYRTPSKVSCFHVSTVFRLKSR